MTATDVPQPTVYQAALNAVHEHCNQCANCREARRYGTWPTTACSIGKKLRRDAARAFGR
jgi:hypothetical protein